MTDLRQQIAQKEDELARLKDHKKTGCGTKNCYWWLGAVYCS